MADRMKQLLAKYGEKKKKPSAAQKHLGRGLQIVDVSEAVAQHTVLKHNEEDEEMDDDEPIIVNLEEFNGAEQKLREEKNRKERLERYQHGWQTVGNVIKKEEQFSDPEDERCQLPPMRHVASTDLSPPRHRRHDTPSPPKGRDLSPPRKRRHDAPPNADLSPPRHRRHDTPSPPKGRDLSPPRKRRHDAPPNADLKLPQKRRHDTPSPPRSKPHKDKSLKSESDDHKGLILSAKEMRKRQEEAESHNQAMSPDADELTGRNAKTIYRRGGKRYDPKEDAEINAMANQKKVYQPTAQQMEWGMGVIQKQQGDVERDEIISSLKSKFGRDQDDPELDNHLRSIQHWDDPMRNMLGQDTTADDALLGGKKLSKKEKKQRDKAWIEQEVARRLRYQGPFQPNRFGIYPGRKWDGVDRSNGFEKNLFLAKAKAAEQKQRNFASEIQGI